MATIDIGKIKPVFKGTYDNSTAYVLDDIVYYNGSSYVAKTSTTGNLPTDTTKWNILASGSGGIWDSTLSLGSAGQSVKVNSGGTALEFGTIISKVRNIGSQTYTNRITSLADSPSGSNGYGGTATIFGSSAFSYTKQSATSYLLVQLGLSGSGGGFAHHGRGTISISTDGSTISNAYICGSSFTPYEGNNWGYWNWKILNNASAQSYNIDFRYGGNGSEFWETINPNGNDHAEWSVATSCEMTVFEIEN